MGKSKKTFIDRKKAVTFQLVHRSQHDPLVADESAPQHVLVETATHKQLQKQQQPNEDDKTKRREEQKKYGILFDDDYNYLQHLKKPEQEVVWEYVENPNQARKRVDNGHVTTAPKLNLPSSVFASEFEEDEGMLNKAAVQPGPHPEWDPDVVAALDDDFDFQDEGNQLDDDFMQHAMGGADDDKDEMDNDEEEEEESDDIGSDFNDYDSEDERELIDHLAPLMRERRFAEDSKSQFTEYSMSSSVIRRNEQLTLLDDRFEQFYATYDDPELGDLGMENIEGAWHQKHPYVLDCLRKSCKTDDTLQYQKEWDKQRVHKYGEIPADNEADPNEELVDYEVDDKQKKWDCESILSTYSNIYNHPKLIDEPRRRSRVSEGASDATVNPSKIQIDPKTGMPTNVLRGGNNSLLTAKALAGLEGANAVTAQTGPKSLCAKSVLSTLSVLSIRPKDESLEEKRDRKRLIKEYRNERRIERKANTLAFKEEKKRQTHVKINQHLNQTGNKIV